MEAKEVRVTEFGIAFDFLGFCIGSGGSSELKCGFGA